MSGCRSERARLAAEIAVGAVGIAAIPLDCALFGHSVASAADPAYAVAAESFSVYVVVSVVVCGVIFLLSLIQAAMFALALQHTAAAYAAAVAAPWAAAVAFTAVGVFYSYLVSGGEVSLTPYIVALGAAESAVFCLPVAMRRGITMRRCRSCSGRSGTDVKEKG